MESWYYKNPEGEVQGPFNTDDMLSWYHQNYLPQELPLSQNPSQGFYPLADWFPNSSTAFQPGAAGQPGRFKQANNQAGAGYGGAAPSKAPGPGPDAAVWYFLDRNRNVQGPFSNGQMLDWFNDGYFEDSLQVYDSSRPQEKWGWKMLRDYFPNIGLAFGNGAKAPKQSAGSGQKPQQAQQQPQGVQSGDRFRFPEWLPAPPSYRGVRKVYPSEKR